MYVYTEPEEGVYTVGHYSPEGTFVPESDHDNPLDAAARVHYLNGGQTPIPSEWFSLLNDFEKLSSSERTIAIRRLEQLIGIKA